MKHARRVILVMVVTAALAADRVATASPQVMPQMAGAARTLAGRFVNAFRRVVPATRFHEDTRSERLPVRAPIVIAPPPPVHLAQGTPFHFRLPPPAQI